MKYHVYMLITAFSYSFHITAEDFTQLKNSLSSLQSSLNILATSLQEITKKAKAEQEKKRKLEETTRLTYLAQNITNDISYPLQKKIQNKIITNDSDIPNAAQEIYTSALKKMYYISKKSSSFEYYMENATFDNQQAFILQLSSLLNNKIEEFQKNTLLKGNLDVLKWSALKTNLIYTFVRNLSTFIKENKERKGEELLKHISPYMTHHKNVSPVLEKANTYGDCGQIFNILLKSMNIIEENFISYANKTITLDTGIEDKRDLPVFKNNLESIIKALQPFNATLSFVFQAFTNHLIAQSEFRRRYGAYSKSIGYIMFANDCLAELALLVTTEKLDETAKDYLEDKQKKIDHVFNTTNLIVSAAFEMVYKLTARWDNLIKNGKNWQKFIEESQNKEFNIETLQKKKEPLKPTSLIKTEAEKYQYINTIYGYLFYDEEFKEWIKKDYYTKLPNLKKFFEALAANLGIQAPELPHPTITLPESIRVDANIKTFLEPAYAYAINNDKNGLYTYLFSTHSSEKPEKIINLFLESKTTSPIPTNWEGQPASTPLYSLKDKTQTLLKAIQEINKLMHSALFNYLNYIIAYENLHEAYDKKTLNKTIIEKYDQQLDNIYKEVPDKIKNILYLDWNSFENYSIILELVNNISQTIKDDENYLKSMNASSMAKQINSSIKKFYQEKPIYFFAPYGQAGVPLAELIKSMKEPNDLILFFKYVLKKQLQEQYKKEEDKKFLNELTKAVDELPNLLLNLTSA